MTRNLSKLLDALRALGGDCTDVEVKSAAGGLPDSLMSTLSALANQPGGGTIILGLDEKDGFQPVGLTNTQELKQGKGKRGHDERAGCGHSSFGKRRCDGRGLSSPLRTLMPQRWAVRQWAHEPPRERDLTVSAAAC